MLEIKLKDVDALHVLSIELDVFTYLQNLVQYDASENVIRSADLRFAQGNARSYLLEKQCSAVSALRKLILREDFIRRISESAHS